jgi:transposase
VKWLLVQGNKIVVFNSDQGHGLLDNNTVSFLTAHGIENTWTNGYSPEENGLVERMNGIVAAQVRCILTTANMPALLWCEDFVFALEVRNISAMKPLNGETT